jgi:hypothetical protein
MRYSLWSKGQYVCESPDMPTALYDARTISILWQTEIAIVDEETNKLTHAVPPTCAKKSA